MVPLTTPEPQCRGEVTTPHVRLRADAIDWAKRHPPGSTLIVHYDPQTRRMVLGGESILNIYPWRKISTTAMILIVAALLIAAGRRRSPLPQDASRIPEIKEE